MVSGRHQPGWARGASCSRAQAHGAHIGRPPRSLGNFLIRMCQCMRPTCTNEEGPRLILPAGRMNACEAHPRRGAVTWCVNGSSWCIHILEGTSEGEPGDHSSRSDLDGRLFVSANAAEKHGLATDGATICCATNALIRRGQALQYTEYSPRTWSTYLLDLNVHSAECRG